MLSELKRYIEEKKLFGPSQKLLLAVSGGIDSMVMAHLFLHLPNQKGIAHCNFSLRGTESDADEQLVNEFASRYNLPFYHVRFDTKKMASENGISIQMAARELRYSWFEEIRKANGYDLVVVAHNMNDNIETMLINLSRGTGLTGLSGIRPSAGTIVRPLLFATREEIENYCRANDVRFREDRSNSDTKYTRNKIRHKVIPVLREINPSIEATLNEAAARFAGIDQVFTRFISDLDKKAIVRSEGVTRIKIQAIKDYLENKSVLFELFSPFGISGSQLRDLSDVINGRTGAMVHTGNFRILKNRDEILVIARQPGEEDHVIIRDVEDFSDSGYVISAEMVRVDDSFKILHDRAYACIDSGKLVFPLTIRKWEAGDFFYPIGMKHKRKLSDYFTDRKYSVYEKELKRLLVSDGKIVWIIGDRLDDRFRITDKTTDALILKSQVIPQEI